MKGFMLRLIKGILVVGLVRKGRLVEERLEGMIREGLGEVVETIEGLEVDLVLILGVKEIRVLVGVDLGTTLELEVMIQEDIEGVIQIRTVLGMGLGVVEETLEEVFCDHNNSYK
jgi:hypothetical protein